MIAKSSSILIQIIMDWRDENLPDRVPGWLGDGKNVGPRMLNFAGGSTKVLHDILEIYPLHFVRIAKSVDGSCMVLKPHIKNTCAWLGYHAWLGGDLGYTKKTILHTCEREIYEKKLLDKKKSEEKLVKDKRLQRKEKPRLPTRYVDLALTTSSDEFSDEPLVNQRELQPVKRQFKDAGRKCFSFPSSVTKPKLKHKLPFLKRSAQDLSYSSPTLQPTAQLGTNPLRTPPRLQSPLAWPPTPSTPSNNNTMRFQFLMATESFGAIPKPLDLSLTSKTFFDEAFSAFTIVKNAPAASQMAGVKVVIKSSAERPIFVPWKNQESFHEMMNILKEKAAGRTGKLDVEVSCILKAR